MLRLRFAALLLALITLVAYLPVTRFGFSCYDDGGYVTNNSVVQNGLTWAGVKWAFTTWHAANWHPLTWLSHMLDCELFGLNAGAQHTINVLFHAANAALLLVLLFRLTGALWPSAFVAALFAWHPLHVESVAWIAERKDVLSTFFEILALLAYTRFASDPSIRNPTPKMIGRRLVVSDLLPPVSGYYWLALFCFALGLMAKPMVVTMPFVMLLLDYWPLIRLANENESAKWPSIFKPEFSGLPRLVLEKWPFFLLSTAACIVTFLAQYNGGAVVSLQNAPLHYRLENIPVAYVSYLSKIFWPTRLVVFYPFHFPTWQALAAATGALLAICGLVWQLRRRCPYGLVGWLWFLGTLVPVIGLVEVGGAAMADRYTYFPSVGIFLAGTFGLRECVKQFRISNALPAGIGAATLLACLALMEKQLRYWRNDVVLFSHAIAVTKNNDIAYLNLGYALEKEGRKDEAMIAFRKSLQIDPNLAEPHNDVANLLADAGRLREALTEFQVALRLDPNYVAAHENLGTLLVQLGRFDEATNQYAVAARLDPEDWHPPYFMGKALLQQGHDREAVSYLQKALKKYPNNPRVLALLAEVLASDENPQIRDGNEALVLASRACALSVGPQPALLDLLAMAYAELGRFDGAVKAEEDALHMANTYRATNSIATIQQRLQLYQKHQPFRQSFIHAPKNASEK